MDFKDYYKILGVEPDADGKSIKTAYRKLARKYHPDMNPDKGAEDKFKEIAEAYHVLKDAQRRAEFDELRKYGSQANQGFQAPPGWQNSRGNANTENAQFDGDFSDFFNSFFTERKQKQQVRGQDVEVELPLMLEDTVNDTTKTIEFFLPVYENGQKKQLKKHLKVTIPQGVTDGEIIRLKGQGSPGPSLENQSSAAGDLYLHVRVIPHPLFEVEGHNLILTLPLAPWEIALGTKVMVPTLTGKINLSIPPNTPAGKKLRIKGKGLRRRGKNADMPPGDLFAIVKIVMPNKIGEKELQLWLQLAKLENFNPRTEWELQP